MRVPCGHEVGLGEEKLDTPVVHHGVGRYGVGVSQQELLLVHEHVEEVHVYKDN